MLLPTFSREGYDPDWLALEDAVGGRYYFGGDLEEEAAAFDKNFTLLASLWPAPEEPLNIFEDTFQASQQEIKYRCYQPTSSTPLPILVFFHGGGMVSGTLDTDEPQCKYYAAKVPCVVVSVEYPLAPKTNIDGIIKVGVEAVQYVSENAERFNGDASKLMVIGGSAGGVLSATIAYHFTSILKDYTTIFGCVLLYPLLANWNYNGKYKERLLGWDELAETDMPIINLKNCREVCEVQGGDPHSPRHFVLLAPDLSHFPPTYVMNTGKELFRDDGLVLKLRLDDEGIRCRFKMYPGLPHWFHAFPQLKMAHVMLSDTVEGIQWLISGEPA